MVPRLDGLGCRLSRLRCIAIERYFVSNGKAGTHVQQKQGAARSPHYLKGLDPEAIQQPNQLHDPDPLKFRVPNTPDGTDHDSSQPLGEFHTREASEVVRTCVK